MSLEYIVKEGVSGFRRARLASFTAIFSLFIAVLLLGVLGRVAYNAYEIAQSVRKSIEVEVFLQDLDQRTTNDLEKEFEQQSLIQEVNYISKDSAAAIFQKEFGSGGSGLADLEFLPASFKLKLKSDTDISQVDSLVSEIKGYRGVDEVEFNQKLLEMMESRFKTVAIAGSSLGILILLAALILVFNTIRLTIYAKRGLIKAMKLVGATNGFIRRPFVVEGLIHGLIAGGGAIVIMFLIFHYLLPGYIPQFGVLEWPFGRWYYLCAGMLVLALLMGFWGSQWAARKFIRETSISD